MSVIDVELLLQAVSDDAPCGSDLEYDPQFLEMGREMLGKPEQQFGDTVVPAEEPNWRQVQALTLALCQQTKDIRIIINLIAALTRNEGFLGFRDGVALLHGVIEKYWETVHPQLDPDDDNDPTIRINILLALVQNKPILDGVRSAAIVAAPVLGKYSLRDVQFAEGLVPSGDREDAANASTIEAAFSSGDLDKIVATANAVNESVEFIEALETLISGYVGQSQSVDFKPLLSDLQFAKRVLGDQLMRLSPEDVPDEESDVSGQTGEGGAQPAAKAALSGEIRNREDVIKALEKVCKYYEKYEPSSPVPLLVNRAKRLVTKDFIDIVRDLAPDAMNQIEQVRGPESND